VNSHKKEITKQGLEMLKREKREETLSTSTSPVGSQQSAVTKKMLIVP